MEADLRDRPRYKAAVAQGTYPDAHIDALVHGVGQRLGKAQIERQRRVLH